MIIATFLSLILSLFTFANSVHLIEVKGSINPGSASYILDSIKRAKEQKAEALVIRLNTPGGLLSSTRDIIQGINESSVPVVVYVAPGGASATSAGALITLSAHVAAMAPGTNIGAAHPVGPQGDDVKGAMGEKVTNDTAALARSQAALRGRKAETAELIVTKSKSYSPDEAKKDGAIDVIASDVVSLLQAIDGKKVSVENPRKEVTLNTKSIDLNSLIPFEMSLQQKFLHFIADPNISTMLLALGGLAIYAEVSSGFTAIIPGIVGAFCLLLAFISLQTLPINVGGALLLGLGFVLLIAEAFITSYGLLTVGAIASIVIGALLLVDPGSSNMQVSFYLLGPMLTGLVAVILTIAYIFRRDQSLPSPSTSDQVVGGRARIASVEGGGLRGTAYVNGELWGFESKEAFAVGDEAIVKSLSGIRIQLERRA